MQKCHKNNVTMKKISIVLKALFYAFFPHILFVRCFSWHILSKQLQISNQIYILVLMCHVAGFYMTELLVKQEQNICLTLHLQKTIAQKRSALTCLSELLRNSSSSSETSALSKTADHYYAMFCTGTCLFLSRWCQVSCYLNKTYSLWKHNI